VKVNVYVEGRADKLAMEALLRDLIDEKARQGVAIGFFEAPSGDKKESLVKRVPEKAVNILHNDSSSVVVAMPDLYPKNRGCKHETPQELFDGIAANFRLALDKYGLDDERLRERFRVFCFKHDLEALLLACESELKSYLNADKLKVEWKTPVEEQNDVRFPKLVVTELFKRHSGKYNPSVDAPSILGVADLEAVVTACPQCFKPFVDFLRGLPTV
jgi:phenylpyruvate tautomerase PptA (4-oxalocrotonate tautomerase family)